MVFTTAIGVRWNVSCIDVEFFPIADVYYTYTSKDYVLYYLSAPVLVCIVLATLPIEALLVSSKYIEKKMGYNYYLYGSLEMKKKSPVKITK